MDSSAPSPSLAPPAPGSPDATPALAPPFADLIRLRPLGPDARGHTRYEGPPTPERAGRTFGGHFLAQGVAAAQAADVGERVLHSLHAHFVRPGDVDAPTVYTVEPVRDGRSFALRSVVATQGPGDGAEVFRLTASFHAPEPGFEYQDGFRYPMDEVPPPGPPLLSYGQFIAAHPDAPAEWQGHRRPIEIWYVNPPAGAEGPPVEEPQLAWLRIAGSLPDDPAAHVAALAYLSDATLIDQVLLPHGYRWMDARLTGASLDHAMWFHRPARADQWLLFDQRVQATGGARGLVTGRLYAADGALVATCTQEGLMRWSGG